MRLDRSLFLSLTVSIAQGCSGLSPRPAPIDPQPAPVANAVIPDASVTDAGASAVLVDEAGAAEVNAPPIDPVEELDALVQAAIPGPCELPPEYEEARARAAMFHMEEMPTPVLGPAKQCDKLREPPGPHCEGFPLLETMCFEVVSRLEQRPALSLMQCLRARSATRAMCRAGTITQCVERAVAPEVPRAAVTPLCDAISRVCGADGGAAKFTPALCERYLSSVRCWQLSEAAMCLASNCRLRPCVEMEL